MVSCAVSGCNSDNDRREKTPTSTHEPKEDIIFSRFPQNELLQKMWLSRCGQNNEHDIKNMFVCSKHFKTDDFYKRSYCPPLKVNKFLKKDAVPSLNLPILIRDCLNSKYASVCFTNVPNQQTECNSPQQLDRPINTDTTNVETKQGLSTMATSCCISGCPTVVNGHNINRLFPFPRKNTKEYYHWMDCCKDSKECINRLKNPLICPLHFNPEVASRGTFWPTDVPTRNLTAEQIKKLKQELTTLNQLVAEWMILTQRNIPDFVINSNSLKEKAKEVARVLRMPYFNIDLGWLHGFEMYLNLNGIRHWRKRRQSSRTAVNKVIYEQSIPEDYDMELMEFKNESPNELNTEQSIETYREALEKVNLLEEYCKRTQNKGAIELVTLMRRVLINTLE